MIKCPTCGKMFQPCTTTFSGFNWRRIACSYDCAQKYVERVEEERRKNRVKQSRGKYLDTSVKRDLGYSAFSDAAAVTNDNK